MTKEIKNNKGFVLLFAVTISAILLSIALGAADIAYREILFGTNARDTNEAFFAADSGAEQALYNDKTLGFYPDNTSATPLIISGLGGSGQACAIVTVDKTGPLYVTVTSKGYNTGDATTCNPTNPNRVERRIEINYLK